ncbi:MAG: hypothetical protein ABR953_07935 [Candidatus Acidiferrales bacterium]
MHLGRRGQPRGESGYAYLMALAIILAVIIGSQIALENLVTQARRQREEQTIWCGNQWARAVRLYYHKTGHYPQSTDDLETGVPDVHFLRLAAYKDPMDPDEGAWRFIYVNGTGQITGSVRYATLQQMALIDLNGGVLPGVQQGAFPGVPVSSMASGNTDTSSASTGTGASNSGASNPNAPNTTTPQGSQGSNSSSSQTSSGTTSNSSNPGTSQNSASDQSGFSTSSTQSGISASGQIPNPLLALQPTGPVDSPVIGAFLTGVGLPTKLDQKSVRIYHGAKKYQDWEFIWNPLEDQAQAIQQGLNPQGVQGQQIGQPIGPGGIGTGPLGNSGSFGGAIVPPSSSPATPPPAPQ